MGKSNRRREGNPPVRITVEMVWDGKAWVTSIPTLSGISTYGSTQEEALENTREMLLGWLDTMERLKLKVPLSNSEGRTRLITSTELASRGGKARAASMSPEERSEAARLAARARWARKRPTRRSRADSPKTE